MERKGRLKSIPEDRDLTTEERELTRWLLEHGGSEAVPFLRQLDRIRVTSRCRCGCASVDFSFDGRPPSVTAAMQLLGDHAWEDDAGHLFGVFVFAREGRLAGLEVWSVDGQADTPKALPAVGWLRPFH